MSNGTCEECGRPLVRYQKRFCTRKCAASRHRGAGNVNFNGGLSTSEGRTVIINRDNTFTYYYRALMEAHLGRELTANEIVHHINGDRSDDRIENLELLTRAQHMEIHRAELHKARGIDPPRSVAA